MSRLAWSLRNIAFGNSTGMGERRGALIYRFVVNIFILSPVGFLPPSMKLLFSYMIACNNCSNWGFLRLSQK